MLIRILRIVRWFFVVVIIFSIFFFSFAVSILTPAGSGEKRQVVISPGMSASDISYELANKKLIKSAAYFKILMKLTRTGNAIKSGTYVISPAEPAIEILNKLVKGVEERDFITIPEGFTVKQIVDLLVEKRAASREHLEYAFSHYDLKIGEEKIANLEGYLFPDTYSIPEGTKAEDIARKMVERFKTQVLPLYDAKKKEIGFSLSEMLTLASLVEREAKVAEERPVIAAVYYNRLKKGMPLQCDATIQYALGETREVLTYKDLELDSPYNTYKHNGLPPGPIANPGIAAIEAVLDPAKVDYMYYVLNEKKNNGSHVFSRTYEEHLKAIKDYQK